MNQETAPGSNQQFGQEGLTIHIYHLTRYVYKGVAVDSLNEARLKPVSDSLQTCKEFNLYIDPPAKVREYPDLYHNIVHYFDVLPPHSELKVTSYSTVWTHPDGRGPVNEQFPLSSLDKDDMRDLLYEYLSATHYVSMEAEIWREAVESIGKEAVDLWQDSVRIGRYIFKNYEYQPSSTTVHTKPVDVVRAKKGVCQDFAHLMIALCRSMKIPARYASGYFLNSDRRPGEIEASHAWVEIFLPGYGWKGYDPTHDRETDTRYVKLAVGRDYGDIIPVCGTFRGRGTRELLVEVKVTLPGWT